jgi:hypothetical protein
MESLGNTTIQILDVSVASTIDGYYSNIFDGTPQDTTGYNTVGILCRSTVPGIIVASHSMDNSVWDMSAATEYPGAITLNSAVYVTETLKAGWYKTQFININETLTAEIRVQTILKK